jgi:signal transduction histidine kinase
MNKINDKSQYLSETINTFRDFLKEEKVLRDQVLQDNIKSAVSIVGTVLKDVNIKFIENIDYDTPINVKIVSGELPQVIINIINNAKDIILEKELVDGWVKIELEEIDKKAIISIEDNGGGIPENIIPRIFEPYFTTKHQSIGTGLGLHMSHRIITESIKGKIYVKNTQNGAKFYIEIPKEG